MKSFILIAALAALAVYNDAASIPDEIPPYQEDIILSEENDEFFQKDYGLEGRSAGRLFDDDELILFYEELVSVPAIPNVVQVREVVYQGNSTTQINRIRVLNGPAQTFVGNYWTHALVRLTSGSGRAIQTRVQFYGSYTNWL